MLGLPRSGRKRRRTGAADHVQAAESYRRPNPQHCFTRCSRAHASNSSWRYELANLIAFLRTLRPHRFGFRPHAGSATLTSGETLTGTILGEGFSDLQLRSEDHKIHLLRRAENGRFREVTSQANWPGYNGDPAGNRYTLLKQINSTNVKSVAPRWVFTLPNVFPLEGTPVVVDE